MKELSLNKNYTINDLKKYASSMNITLDNLLTCINIVNKYNDKYKTINDVLLETKKYINIFSLNDILNYIYIFNDSEIILPVDIDLSSNNVKGSLPLSKLSTGILENTEELDKFLVVDLNNNIKIIDKNSINSNNIKLSVDIEADKENITKASSAKAVYDFTYSKEEVDNKLIVKKYSNDLGIWTETLLNTKEILLQGYNTNTVLTNGTKTITLPKEIKTHLGCNPIYTTPQTQQLSCSLDTNSFTINGANDAVVLWYYSGILK